MKVNDVLNQFQFCLKQFSKFLFIYFLELFDILSLKMEKGELHEGIIPQALMHPYQIYCFIWNSGKM
jgi:hypothetical protein